MICPITKEIRYIGKTSLTLKQRLSNHNMGSSDGLFRWKDMLERKKMKPTMKVIEYTTSDLANEREKYWILFHAYSGSKLFNTNHNPFKPATK